MAVQPFFDPDYEPYIMSMFHESVLPNEVIQQLDPKDGEVYVDATFGAGGHTRQILEAADCKVIGVDRDSYVEQFASKISKEYDDRFTFLLGQFSQLESLLAEQGIKQVNGILVDLGVSSMQLDTPERGFSFQHDGPLDMRMSNEGPDAKDVVNNMREEELANIIFKYGGERYSRKIAQAIVAARATAPIMRTSQLAEIIRNVIGVRPDDKIDPATRTFQALRIYINNELEEIEILLETAEKILAPEGRLVTIAFHSGEDRIIKQFLAERSGKKVGFSRYHPIPIPSQEAKPTFSLLSKKAITPGEEEISDNVRARSAKLRAAMRTNAPSWQESAQ